jgi:Uma2 family endonuclease
MAMAISIPRYTIADLGRLPNDGSRYEVLDGVLLVTPAPSHAHQIIVNCLQFQLMQAVMIPGKGQVVGPGAITVPPRTQLQPDILVHPDRYPVDSMWEDIDEHWLAVEVLSRSSRVYDREIKRDAYITLGVHEVWLVDRWSKEVEVSHARGSGVIVRDVLQWRVRELAVNVEISLNDVFVGL